MRYNFCVNLFYNILLILSHEALYPGFNSKEAALLYISLLPYILTAPSIRTVFIAASSG
jgi:hypothetical protein